MQWFHVVLVIEVLEVLVVTEAEVEVQILTIDHALPFVRVIQVYVAVPRLVAVQAVPDLLIYLLDQDEAIIDQEMLGRKE